MSRAAERICASCGKRMKKVYGIFPSEYIPDTVSAVCGQCRALICYTCRNSQMGTPTCPKCGSSLLITVTDEDLDTLELHGNLLGRGAPSSHQIAQLEASISKVPPGGETFRRGKLMWQAVSGGRRRTFAEAQEYCRKLSLEGHSDWRLPTLTEYEELGEPTKVGEEYWTSTTEPSLGKDIAYIHDGTTMFKSNEYYVRAVRLVAQEETSPVAAPPARPREQAVPPVCVSLPRVSEPAASSSLPRVSEAAPAARVHPYDAGLDEPVASVHYASFGRRFVALVIDYLVLGLITAVIMPLLPKMSLWGEAASSFLTAMLYFVPAVSSRARGSVGKMVAGLAVVDAQGKQVSPVASLVRYLVYIVSNLFFGLGCLFMVLSPTRQTWHDIAARTYVVQRPRGRQY